MPEKPIFEKKRKCTREREHDVFFCALLKLVLISEKAFHFDKEFPQIPDPDIKDLKRLFAFQ